MSQHTLTEYVTSPSVTIPVGGAALVGLVSYLPIIINLLVGFYFFLMVMHKLYQMWKEWKVDRNAASK